MTRVDDIAYSSALELAERYRTKALSPVEVAEALFARREALEPRLNAFCIVDRDGAMASARAAERRFAAGEPLGTLDGVPVTIKDLVMMRGFPTRRGSRLVEPVPDAEDGPAVARLREAGRHPRQDDGARIWLEGARQLALDRHHPQPVEP